MGPSRNRWDRFQEEAICLTCLVALETGSRRACEGVKGDSRSFVGRGGRVRDTSWHWSPETKLPKWAERHV